ncbi:MAG TPA: hypothetical protein VLS89_05270, partial [Candidatus Nanopelagicales bacterium]|nr:hypothetical protein [Candidatus Nanopelagicales bacterium]
PTPFAALWRAAWEGGAEEAPAGSAPISTRRAGLRMTVAVFAAGTALMLPVAGPGGAAAEPPFGRAASARSHERRFPRGRLIALRGQLCVRAMMAPGPGLEEDTAMTGGKP